MRATVIVALCALLVAAGAPAASGATAPATDLNAQTADCSFPVTETDATGTEVTVSEDPERVVVTAASGAQTMWEIGADGEVVGMPKKSWTSYLDGYEEKSEVTNDMGRLVVEETVAANPNLVLAANITSDEKIRTLREDFGIAVYKFELAGSIDDIAAKTNRTGRLTGNCDAAAERSAAFKERVNVLDEAVASEEPIDVYYHMGDRYTATEGSFIHDVLVTAGGHNVATDLNLGLYGQTPSYESVVDADPTYIVVSYSDEPPEDPAETLPAALDNTTAVREGNVIAVNANYVSQPAPRVTRPLTKLASEFHPEAYAAANITTTAENDTETTATDEGLPGFGVPAALAALSLIALGLGAGQRRGRN